MIGFDTIIRNEPNLIPKASLRSILPIAVGNSHFKLISNITLVYLFIFCSSTSITCIPLSGGMY